MAHDSRDRRDSAAGLRRPLEGIITGWRAATAAPVHLFRTQHAEGKPTPPTPNFVLGMVIAGCFSGTFDLGAGRFGSEASVGTLMLGPPNLGCDYRAKGPGQVLMLALPEDYVRASLEPVVAGPIDFGCLHAGAFHDPLLGALCWRLWEEAAAPHRADALRSDETSMTLLQVLCRRSSRRLELPRSRTKLSRAAWGRVREYLQGHYARNVTLDELAAVAGMSRFHFARVFRRTTGLPPHQYLVRLRLERALALMRSSRAPLSAIAAAVGFTDQCHLARHCRRVLGRTPAELRQAFPGA